VLVKGRISFAENNRYIDLPADEKMEDIHSLSELHICMILKTSNLACLQQILAGITALVVMLRMDSFDHKIS